MTREDLKVMQAWPLERKIMVTQTRIIEWYEHFQGNVCVSFSGGKDSTVLLHIARQIYPDIEAVFVDTGLEYPEIRDFVKTKENVTWLKPEMRFNEVIKTYGYPVISKDVSCCLRYAKKGSEWALRHLEGQKTNGQPDEFKTNMYKKWKPLLDAPFKISDDCCRFMKERPLDIYYKKNKKKPIVGMMAAESRRRLEAWKKTGCNAFSGKKATSKPMSFWTEQDVLAYIKMYNLPYASVYGDIVEVDGKLKTTGCERTGCIFCMFGCHLEKQPNRFQKLKITHPKQYEYCMRPIEENGLGLDAVLNYIGVPH